MNDQFRVFIDCTTNDIIIALYLKEKLIKSRIIPTKKNMTDLVIYELKTLLDTKNIHLKELQYLYINHGPGSFTGIRIVLTIAKLLLVSNKGIKVYFLDTFNIYREDPSVLIFMDARGGRYFVMTQNDNRYQLVSKIDLDKLKSNDQYQDLDQYDRRKSLTKLPFSSFKEAKEIDDLYGNYIKDEL
ncbi:tRNA (adenosine(37)-N6)-threonylcarbamoyltransferase complex dimerization subunit type 1 TsaB [Ureaplasma canigenitalium]|uniref:tRNA (adenosine(37)-N6)-threonylcarbamoyltransferase complex dimerization subunit type 1 TsaB n=1 Tax=Ureaplasma canigenitalium TaxID=42092 RepID=UPI0004E1BF36|nr:tRNA (adenosine(37)-N6)-threonylcarbamoyltransferase complex dimerization subunit type 1 TsaB [Ureaplasma canigenitalium]